MSLEPKILQPRHPPIEECLAIMAPLGSRIRGHSNTGQGVRSSRSTAIAMERTVVPESTGSSAAVRRSLGRAHGRSAQSQTANALKTDSGWNLKTFPSLMAGTVFAMVRLRRVCSLFSRYRPVEGGLRSSAPFRRTPDRLLQNTTACLR